MYVKPTERERERDYAVWFELDHTHNRDVNDDAITLTDHRTRAPERKHTLNSHTLSSVSLRFTSFFVRRLAVKILTAEAVQSAPLPLQGVHDVHGGDGLPLGVLRVRDGVADHILEEHLQHSASLLVYQAGYTFDAAPAGETTDGRLRDALDVIAQHFPVTLRSAFSQTLSTLTATGHVDYVTAVCTLLVLLLTLRSSRVTGRRSTANVR